MKVNQDSLLWFKGSLVTAAPSPPQQVSSVFTSVPNYGSHFFGMSTASKEK